MGREASDDSIQEEKNLTGKIHCIEYELQVLPMLILATFAANTLIPTYLQQSGTDENSEQTLYYQKLGRNGLRRLSGAWSQIS